MPTISPYLFIKIAVTPAFRSLFCLLFFFSFLFPACQAEEEANEAQQVVNKAIETHGGKAFEQAHFTFDFRDRSYVYKREGGLYEYRRLFTDNTGQHYVDILNNSGFSRLINGDTAKLTEERALAYTNSVNSVIYFALLPYRLNDEAVQKEYLGQTEIAGEPYHKLKITFEKDSGGEDYEDIFIYWFHQDNHTLDYLAYSFQENGGGFRFRKAYNPRMVGGIRWQDYINYKPVSMEGIQLEQLDELFQAGKLEELSRIELENIQALE